MVTARMAGFSPGTSPPPVRTPTTPLALTFGLPFDFWFAIVLSQLEREIVHEPENFGPGPTIPLPTFAEEQASVGRASECRLSCSAPQVNSGAIESRTE